MGHSSGNRHVRGSAAPAQRSRGANLNYDHNVDGEYELFECRMDGSVLWCGASRLARVRGDLRTLVDATNKEYFAMRPRTGELVFPAEAPAIGQHVFQIAYTQNLCKERARLLRRLGYGVLSVIGNNVAKALLTAIQSCADGITFFMIGHAAPQPTRKEMVDWVRPRYPKSKILVLNPPNQETPGADYNVLHNGPELWLPIVTRTDSRSLVA